MRRNKIDLVILVILMVLPAMRTRADGCFVSGKFAALQAPQQKVAISWDGQRQVMVLATRVRASEIADFGWVIPIKSTVKPEVELGDSKVFDLLEDYFKPIPRMALILSAGPSARKVEVLETKDIGIYKVTIVRATEGKAFSAWLTAHDFKSTQALEDMLRSYALNEFFFVLAKIDLSLLYKADIDFMQRQAYVADVKSLDGKAIKALTALRWPRGGKSLAELGAWEVGVIRGRVREEALSADATSADSEATKAAAAFRWPAGGESLAEMTAADILADKPYRSSSLASHPLNEAYHLMAPADYETLRVQHAAALGYQRIDLVEELSERFLANQSIQHFVRIESIYKNLEAGVANPLKISFAPAAPFFPMRISSVNEGKVGVIAYILADQPYVDVGEILKAEVWKPVDDDLRQQLSDSLDISQAECLTKLTFAGDSSAFVRDIHFEPMIDEQKKRLLEESQIVAALLPQALWRSPDVNAVKTILDEHPRASEFLDDAYIPRFVRQMTSRSSRFMEPSEPARVAMMIDIVRLLHDHGFQINARDFGGGTAVHILVNARELSANARQELLAFALNAGGEINARDARGSTVLHSLVREEGCHGLLAFILDAGGQVDARDADGQTALHILAKAGRYRWDALREPMACLLDAGAQINAKDAEGKTPLDHVFDHTQPYPTESLQQMAAFLIRRGGTLGHWDRGDLGRIKGRFAKEILPALKEAGNAEIIDLLVQGGALPKAAQSAVPPPHGVGVLRDGTVQTTARGAEERAHSVVTGKAEIINLCPGVRTLPVADDFEGYDDEENRIFDTWPDGFVNGTGSKVGHFEAPFAEREIVHSGKQSMPLFYDNTAAPWHSETERVWKTAQDWTSNDADTLELYFRGKADNAVEWLYILIEDRTGHIAVVTHPDVNAVLTTQWQPWHIPFAHLRAAGVDMTAITKLSIGLGDLSNPHAGGAGSLYIDDVRGRKQAQ